MAPPPRRPVWIRVAKFCVNKGCRRVATSAVKVSDFWVARCDQCRDKEITLDMDKVVSENPEERW